jgi:hypothetical protein
VRRIIATGSVSGSAASFDPGMFQRSQNEPYWLPDGTKLITSGTACVQTPAIRWDGERNRAIYFLPFAKPARLPGVVSGSMMSASGPPVSPATIGFPGTVS